MQAKTADGRMKFVPRVVQRPRHLLRGVSSAGERETQGRCCNPCSTFREAVRSGHTIQVTYAAAPKWAMGAVGPVLR